MKIQTAGKLLIALGVLTIFYAWNMPVSNGYSGVINLHLMNQKQNALIIGGVLFISGIILFATFKIKQTKTEERLDAEALDTLKQKTSEKLTEGLSNGRRAAKMLFERISDKDGQPVVAWNDHRIARITTGIFVGVCISGALGDLFLYRHSFLIGIPFAIWLAFRPRSASLVIFRMNIANIGILLFELLILFVQDLFDEYSFNSQLEVELIIYVAISFMLGVYANKRLKPKS